MLNSKSEYLNPKQTLNPNDQKSKQPKAANVWFLFWKSGF